MSDKAAGGIGGGSVWGEKPKEPHSDTWPLTPGQKAFYDNVLLERSLPLLLHLGFEGDKK